MAGGPSYNFPLAGLFMGLFFLAVIFLFAFVQVGAISLAFAKLGLTPQQGFIALMATLFGAGINLPLWRTGRQVKVCAPKLDMLFRHHRGLWHKCEDGELVDQTVSVNLGGCLIPCLLSAWLISRHGLSLSLIIAVVVVSAACYKLARPVEGVGIGIPLLAPPLVTVLAALFLSTPEQAPMVAYVAGSLGTLIGADVLHLMTPGTMNRLEAPMLSIGGAGTFDGIFITGILAVLLT